MKEDFVHYLWKHRLVGGKSLFTTDGSPLEIIYPGHENMDAGPDFLAARIRIDGTMWAGNVEIHVLSSSWYAHGHHKDASYDNIILHVAYECDKEVLKNNGDPIPHLEMRKYCNPRLESRYLMLMQNRTVIPCAKLLGNVNDFTFRHWLCRLLICRLERKASEAHQFLHYFGNNWEHLCLFLVARYLGGKANAGTFGLLIQRTPFIVLMKNHDNVLVLEALLFGQAGLLEKPFRESYPLQLKSEYQYLKKKYELPEKMETHLWKYARMRPANFPDVRIAQLASMVHVNQGQLFQKMLALRDKDKLYAMMRPTGNAYWSTHYRLDSKSIKNGIKIGAAAMYTVLINVLVPLFFLYGKERDKQCLVDRALDVLADIPGEENRITKIWKQLGKTPYHAGESQGMIELYKHYCIPKSCLKCNAGHQILKRP